MCIRPMSGRKTSEEKRRGKLMDETDLLVRQKKTWINIPARLRDLILKQVRVSLEEQIVQNSGTEPENTIGYEDDHEKLEAELLGREARRKEKLRAPKALEIAGGSKPVAVEVAVRSESAGGGDTADSQENWFIAPEGESVARRQIGNSEGASGSAVVEDQQEPNENIMDVLEANPDSSNDREDVEGGSATGTGDDKA